MTETSEHLLLDYINVSRLPYLSSTSVVSGWQSCNDLKQKQVVGAGEEGDGF